MTTLPVDSLVLCIIKEHPLKLKYGLSLSYIIGNIYSFNNLSFFLLFYDVHSPGKFGLPGTY
jgi:hypothetical protein